MKETDIAQGFVDYLSKDFNLYFEVPAGGIIDIVAVRPPLIVAVEVKTSFSMAVIEQGLKNKNYAHYSYVAVPRSTNRFAERVCRDYGIGVLAGYKDSVYEIIPPQLNRKPALIKHLKLDEWMKENVPGCQSGRLTGFQVMVRGLVDYIKRRGNPGVKYVEAYQVIGVSRYYSSLTAFRSNMYQWIRSGVVKELKIYNGMLYLSENFIT